MGKRAFTGEMLPVFYVRDVDRSVEFYRDILGFEFHHF
jgi:catechol 2,3-dioxygenase-like lactoylglutathione lyase family enzyme